MGKNLLLFFFILFFLPGWAQNILFPDTVRFCRADSIILDAGPGWDTYTWSTGDTTQMVWIYASGDYSIEVTQGDTVNYSEDFYTVLVSAGIVQEPGSIDCGDTVLLTGTDPAYEYLWTPGDVLNDSIVVFPRDTTVYFALVQDPLISYHYCTDSLVVEVEPRIIVDTTIQQGIGCPGENKAKIKLNVSGGYPPYDFDWPPPAIPLFEDPSFAIGITDGEKTVVITDTIGCYINHTFTVKAHRLPELELYSNPEDTVFLQNPYVLFYYENPWYDSLAVDTFNVTWWEWDFGDSATSTNLTPTHIYQTDGTYEVVLSFRTFYECFGTDTLDMLVRPVELLVPSVITPNGDFLNDTFEIWEGTGGGEDPEEKSSWSIQSLDPIDLSKYYLSNTLIIFNRWGEKVYEVDNYENDWDGGGLSDGMYYYVLKCTGEHRTDEYKGSLLILTGNN